jgi:DNA-binding transcriptional LysR family regulator
MQHQPRLQALADLDAEIAKAETEVARWARVVERMSAAGEPTRAARGFLRVAQDDLRRLDEARNALSGGEDDHRTRRASASFQG